MEFVLIFPLLPRRNMSDCRQSEPHWLEEEKKMQREALGCTCDSLTPLQANHYQARRNHHFISFRCTAPRPNIHVRSFFVLFSSQFLIYILFSALFSLCDFFSSSLVDSNGGCIGSSASVWADKCLWVKSTTLLSKILYVCLATTGVRVWVCVDVWAHICSASSGRSDAPWWQQRRECDIQQHSCYRIMENVSLISAIIGLYCSLYIS